MAEQIVLTDLVNLQNETTAVNAINSNNATIEDTFLDVLSLSGTAPNQMQSQLDMNSNQIINLPAPLTGSSPARLQDLASANGGGTITNIPAGGNTGDALVKNSGTNYDVKWSADSNTVSGGTNIAITGTSPAVVSTIANPVFSTSVSTPTLINTGTLTLPTVTDTLVARTTTDTLSNKTLVAPALGTPTSGILTNATGLPISTGVSGLSTGVATFLGNASSVTLAPAIADRTGSGSLAFATSPTLVTPILGTPTSGILTNVTGLPLTSGVTGILPRANGGTQSSGGAVVTVKTQVFSSSGTYTPSTGMLYAFMECWGGGGGGGGTANTTTNVGAGGGGGGAGGYSSKTSSAATIGASQTVTIGAAGTGATAGNNTGGNGTATSVGALCVANGGTGGGGSAGSGFPTAGAGGTAGTGDVAATGQPGHAMPGFTGSNGYGGFGGSTLVGGGAPPQMSATTTTGAAGSGHGSGGSGGASFSAGGAAAGGSGTTGFIRITEYCNQ